MNKFWKILISVILLLVIVVGVYVGIVTKGFRKWKNLKAEKETVTNFYYNGKTGVPSEDYTKLQEKYNNLEKMLYYSLEKEENSAYIISKSNSCTSFLVDTGNMGFILNVLDSKSVYNFVENTPKTSQAINDLKNMFGKS